MKLTPLFVAFGAALAATATQAAVYQVVELSPADGYKNSFAAGLNNNDQIVGNLNNRFNYPVDLASVDFTNTVITSSLTAAEIEEIKKGNVNAKALSVLLTYLQTNAPDYKVQRLASVYPSLLGSKQLLTLRDSATPKTNDEYLVDVSDRGEFVGYAWSPFTKQSFTPAPTEATPTPATEQLWVPGPMSIAGVVLTEQGRVILPPLYAELGGGFSVARGINNSGKVIGTASVGMSDANITTIQTACDGKALPVALCQYTYGSAFYDSKAVVWQLDATGKPGAPTPLGYLGDKNTGKAHTRTDYPVVNYASAANGINERGLVVGVSTYSNSDEIRTVYIGYVAQDVVFNATHATIFDGSEVKSFIDVNRWINSEAKAVNNKDLVVGYASELVNGASAPRFFVYDYASKQLNFPTTLFSSANTLPEAINDAGYVVGTSQNYLTGYARPRQVGFLYNHNTGSFQDLNKLVGCNSPYTIVQAVDINDKNVIVANAVKEVEQRDSKGEVIKDASGNPLKEETAVALKLVPVPNGAIDDCAPPPEATYERQGGATWWTLLLLPLAAWRRFRRG